MGLAETYDKIAKDYSKANYQTFWKKEFPVFKKMLKGRKVVDLGCGAGRDAEVFVKNKFDYLGTDISKGMIAIAKKRVPKGQFLVMDLYKLKLPKESFDGFWAAASLLHIPKSRAGKVLGSIRELLKKNGVGFISLKQKKHLEEGVITQNILSGKVMIRPIKRFFAFYTKAEFKKILERSGFRLIKFTIKYWKPDDTTWLCFFVKKN